MQTISTLFLHLLECQLMLCKIKLQIRCVFPYESSMSFSVELTDFDLHLKLSLLNLGNTGMYFIQGSLSKYLVKQGIS